MCDNPPEISGSKRSQHTASAGFLKIGDRLFYFERKFLTVKNSHSLSNLNKTFIFMFKLGLLLIAERIIN